MPFVTVRWYSSKDMDLTIASDIAEVLPELVATSLHIEEITKAHLTIGDIEVVVEEGNPEVDVLPSQLDFIVRVEATYFSKRAEVVDVTAEWIKSRLLERVPNLSFNVWIVLPIAGYAETG